jgi:hypothetical protein
MHPVELQIDSNAIANTGTPGNRATTTVADLVGQGLHAQLSTQSLLTGLLYVDLDLRSTPGQPVRRRSDGLTQPHAAHDPAVAAEAVAERRPHPAAG